MKRTARDILARSSALAQHNRVAVPPVARLHGSANTLIFRPNAPFVTTRPFSSTTTTTANTSSTTTSSAAASSTTASKEKDSKKKKEDNSNFFLDNLGKIFLTAIAGVIAWLVRSSRNTKNRMIIRDELEDKAVVDPMEINDLRIANSLLTPDVFRSIISDAHVNFRDGFCTYSEFVKVVRTTMKRLKGEAFTVQMGHMLDRIVVDVLHKRNKSPEDRLPVSLWLSTLTLALNSSVGDRVRMLFETLEAEDDDSVVTVAQVQEMVGYLQDTWQLPPDTQLIETDVKYPTQQWKIGTPTELVPWEGLDSDKVDLEAFASIVRSRSVCAWGECYHKKKFESVDDM